MTKDPSALPQPSGTGRSRLSASRANPSAGHVSATLLRPPLRKPLSAFRKSNPGWFMPFCRPRTGQNSDKRPKLLWIPGPCFARKDGLEAVFAKRERPPKRWCSSITVQEHFARPVRISADNRSFTGTARASDNRRAGSAPADLCSDHHPDRHCPVTAAVTMMVLASCSLVDAARHTPARSSMVPTRVASSSSNTPHRGFPKPGSGLQERHH